MNARKRTTAQAQRLRRGRRIRQIAANARTRAKAEVTPQPITRYGAILIDPPWRFEVWSRDTGMGRSAESHYPTMPLDDIKALPVVDIMADDCAVFMWATWPTLPDALALGAAWGLEYKTCAFNWCKLNKRQTDKPFQGMGYWTRANSEPCLLFTKGHPHRKDKGVEQMIVDWVGGFWDDFETETIATPIQRHSQKPDAVYSRIEALIGGPYCEMFARRTRVGWSRWGNDVSDLPLFADAPTAAQTTAGGNEKPRISRGCVV